MKDAVRKIAWWEYMRPLGEAIGAETEEGLGRKVLRAALALPLFPLFVLLFEGKLD